MHLLTWEGVRLSGDEIAVRMRAIDRKSLSANLLHVLGDLKKVLLALRSVLAENGTMTVTTLIMNNRPADKYLKMVLKKRVTWRLVR